MKRRLDGTHDDIQVKELENELNVKLGTIEKLESELVGKRKVGRENDKAFYELENEGVNKEH